jgi:hypothetical protein
VPTTTVLGSHSLREAEPDDRSPEPDSPRHILAVLHGDESEMLLILDAALRLARGSRVRLTLLIDADPGFAGYWLSPLAQEFGLPPLAEDLERWLAGLLPVIIARVPEFLPVTTVVATRRFSRRLAGLTGQARYDVMVISGNASLGQRRLRRHAERCGIPIHAATAFDRTSAQAL